MMFDTRWPADSVEFCPHAGSQDVFVCGTYNLESTRTNADDDGGQTVQRRRGKCMVFRVASDGDGFSPVQEVDLPGVLDMKWCHRSSASTAVVGIADSEGDVTLYEWAEDSELVPLQRVRCAADRLCLSLDWSNRRHRSATLGDLVVSLSDGSLSLLKPHSHAALVPFQRWHAHDHEPWIAAWDCWNDAVVYSGGDDLRLKAWDQRQGFHRPIFVNSRFDAGVTSIQSHPHIEHLIAVGTYANQVRLFDARQPLNPLIDAHVGGGAWRVKWHPSIQRKHDLLVACMHDGFKVVRFLPSTNASDAGLLAHGATYEIKKRYDQHQSLAYGADWSFQHHNDGDSLIATCSFYDCALHLWSG